MRLNADYIVYDEEEGSYIPVTNKAPFKDIVRNDGTAAYVIENLVDETTWFQNLQASAVRQLSMMLQMLFIDFMKLGHL